MRSLLLVLLLPTLALAAPAKVAVVVGVNRSPSEKRPALRFADDDAVAYARLLTGLGFEVTLLTRPDLRAEATALGPLPAERAIVLAALEQAAQTAAAAPGGDVILTFNGYASPQLTLEDGELTLEDLLPFAARLKHAQTRLHLVVDACAERRAARALLALEPRRLGWPDNVGLIALGSEEAGDEPEALQAGRLSHGVRSAVAAGDVDGDRVLTYPEVVAFVARQGGLKPRAHAPKGAALLALTGPTLTLEMQGRCSLQTASGLPIAQWRKAGAAALTLTVPPGAKTLTCDQGGAQVSATLVDGPALGPLTATEGPALPGESEPTDAPVSLTLPPPEARPTALRWRTEAALWMSQSAPTGVEVQINRRFFDVLPEVGLEVGLGYQKGEGEATDAVGDTVETENERWTLGLKTMGMPQRWVDVGLELAGGLLIRTVDLESKGDFVGRARLVAGATFKVGGGLYIGPTLSAGASFYRADAELKHPLELSLGLGLELP